MEGGFWVFVEIELGISYFRYLYKMSVCVCFFLGVVWIVFVEFGIFV